MSTGTRLSLALVTSLLMFTVGVFGKGKHLKGPANPSQDEIQVLAHLPNTGGPVTQFLFTQHYRRNYLYAAHDSGKQVTLMDITDLRHPAVLADMSYPTGTTENMIAAVGNAALIGNVPTPSGTVSAPQTFRIVSFADPSHPIVKQQFANVTAMSRDDRRGLIVLANSDGIWVLRQQFAPDPEAEKEWEHMMLDAR